MNIKNIIFITTILSTYNASALDRYYPNYKPDKYIKLESGFSFQNRFNSTIKDNTNKNVKNAFGGIGYGFDFAEGIRLEANILYLPASSYTLSKADGSKVEFKIAHLAGIINSYFTLNNFENINPFVYFGLGMVHNRLSKMNHLDQSGNLINTQVKKNKKQLAWNIGLGATYDINNRLKLDLGYRYLELGSSGRYSTYGDASGSLAGHTHTDNSTYAHKFTRIRSSQITLGIRYYIDNK